MAEVRIFNPDGSEAELSGNGVREAVMYLRRNGWVDEDRFSVRTAAGEIRPRITGPTSARSTWAGAAALERDFPGGEDGTGTLRSAGREFAFQFVQVGNPQCAIEVDEGLEELDLARYGPPIERHELFPAPHQRLVLAAHAATPRSARGSSSAAWGRRCRRAPARPAPPWPRCCAASTSPVTVRLDGGELEVEVGEDLHVDLTGWARPVYRGELSDELVEELAVRAE